MRKITLIQKFSLLCLAVLVLFGIVFGWIITTSLEHNILDRSKKVTAIIVSEEVQKELADTDLITPKMGSEFDAFAERVKHLSLGPDIVRIKIWNKGQVVVWSDEKRLIGQRFPDNEELKGALNGEITSEISTLKKSEQKFERQFKRLLELYVPIRFNGKTDIETVFEIYQNLDHLYADISHLKSIVWTSVISGFVFLYLILFG